MRIIAGFAGVGKSCYCEKNPNAVDFVVMPYKYSNFYEVAAVAEGETIKANEDLILRPGWHGQIAVLNKPKCYKVENLDFGTEEEEWK